MSETITLGGVAYPVGKLSMRQMRRVLPAITRLGIETMDGVAAQISVIQAGMEAADPKIDVEFVDNIIGVTIDEISDAVRTIGIMNGLIQAGEAPAAGRRKPKR